MEWVNVLKDYVPLFQTMVWVLLVIFVLVLFYQPLRKRIEEGAIKGSLNLGPADLSIELPAFVRDLPKVEPADPRVIYVEERKLIPPPWTKERDKIYLRNQDRFLVHVFEPSKQPHQKFDIFIFLVRHKGVREHEGVNSSIDIDYAEFFLGTFWGNRVFKVQNEGTPIGISTSAYGPFLAICRVVFKDGYEVILDRYIDYTMEKKVAVP